MRSLAFTTALVLTACSDRGGPEQLTVVVEADRTRALADQARLQEMQQSLADATQELVDTRKDLTSLRERLLKTGALTGDEMKKLEEREARLVAREGGAPAPASGPSAGITKADVEELLRAQDERMRAVLASAAVGAPVAAAPVSMPQATAAPEREAVVTSLAALSALRSQRGLREDDVEGGPALQRRIDEALAAGRIAAALESVAELRRKTEGTLVNGAFVKRKYGRASARLEVMAPAVKDKAKRLLGEANTKNAKGDAAGANEALNAILAM